jgi:hypothetical protein
VKIQYVEPKRITRDTRDTIKTINAIVDEYKGQGFDLTLRQLFYQFVARGLAPNTEKSYKRIGNVLNDGRLYGMIDWNSVVDRTRNPSIPYVQPFMEACIEYAPRLLTETYWEGQDSYVEVWVEKEALAGVIKRAVSDLQIPTVCCRGYVSQSAMWQAAMRIEDRIDCGGLYGERPERAEIIYLGDHDPSGIDMTRDIRDRMEMFGVAVDVVRIALNMPQIELYNPPPNPTKLSDSRAGGYIENHGYECWELDALEPKLLVTMIREEVFKHIDLNAWNRQLESEKEKKRI